MTLAGYIQSAEHEYAFVILADRVGRYYAAESAARSIIDRLLGKLAAPPLLKDGEDETLNQAVAGAETDLATANT